MLIENVPLVADKSLVCSSCQSRQFSAPGDLISILKRVVEEFRGELSERKMRPWYVIPFAEPLFGTNKNKTNKINSVLRTRSTQYLSDKTYFR